MAGDWIKVRTALPTHPKIVRMASALNADRFRTLGGILSVWCLFDAHSEDGHLDGYTAEALDSAVGFPGISAAMCAVGWLEIHESGLFLPSFKTHNGTSAKRRAQDADRKYNDRKKSASKADKNQTREEKRREEEIPPLPPSGGKAKRGSSIPFEAIPSEYRDEARRIRPELDSLSITRLGEQFVDHHRQKGTIGKDWLAGWRTWLRNDLKFSASLPPPVSGHVPRNLVSA